MTASASAGPASVDPAPENHLVGLTDDWSLWRLAGLRSAGMPYSWLDQLAGWQDLGEVGPEPAMPNGTGPSDDARLRESSAEAIRALVMQPRFLEAVTWQNAQLVDNWLGEYALRVSVGETALTRRDQREPLIAFLAQRYCAKNETIGFFGPVSWARFVDVDSGLAVEGTGELTHRSLHAETWAVAAVADTLAEDEQLYDHLLARRNPTCDVQDGMLLAPRRSPEPLADVAARLLGALSGPLRVGDLLDRCVGEGSDRTEVAATLAELSAAGAVLVGWPVPVGHHPHRRLGGLIEGIADPELRAHVCKRVQPLVIAMASVRSSAGRPEELARSLRALQDEFAAFTGQAGRRDKSDRRYGRALVYEDSRRDLRATIGSDLVDDLRAPLGMLLDSARWFASELGREVERDLTERHRELRERRATPISLADLVTASGDILGGSPGTAVHRVVEDFDARWTELVGTADENGRMRTGRLRSLAAALFPPGRVHWRAGRQHSPDLMLAAGASPTQRPFWVLGELHMALNTLENRPFVTQADDQAELLDATSADFAAGRIVPVYPPDAPEVTSRTYPPLAMDLPDRYVYWSYTRDEGHPGVDSPLPGAGLLIEPTRTGLAVRLPGGKLQGDVLEFLGEFLTALAVDRFRVRAPARHAPRLLLDDVVVARESWRIPVREMPLVAARDDYGHRALRTWLAELGTPRLLFVRTPGQPKPWLIDRQSPLSLRNFARLARRLLAEDADACVTMSEMLPTPDQLWLSDSYGHYTSEMRVVAVDSRQTNEPLLVDVDPRGVS